MVRLVALLLGIALLGSAVDVDASAAEPDLQFGTKHAVLLRSNGDVLTWGDNVMCQLGRATTGNVDRKPGLVMRNAKEIAVASEHTLVLTADGKVYGWGMNAEGPLGTGNTHDVCEGPELIASLADQPIAHIATGYGFSVAVTTNGDLYCSGDNSMGQCPVTRMGTGRAESFMPLAIPELTGHVAAIKAGSFHTLALTTEGTLYAFGRGRDGQLGGGRAENGKNAVASLTDVVSFAAGTWHSVAVQADGTVWAWGNDSKSQLCDGATTNRLEPTRVTLADPQAKVVRVAAGGHSTLLKTSDGALITCGDTQFKPSSTAPKAAGPLLTVAGDHAAFSPDACTVRITGPTDDGVGVATGVQICGAAPASSATLANVVHEAPHGGESGCWTPRAEEDAVANPKWKGLREALIAAEAVLKNNAAFMAAPKPVRMRTTIAAGPYAESGASLHVKAVAERKQDGTRIWSDRCTVIPQVDRIGGSIGQISIFLNPDPRMFIGHNGAAPTRTGEIAGYPIYNDWVLITKDGRLPDSTFPDFHDPNRIQVIAVRFGVDGKWGQQTKDSFDWPALAALLK